MNVARWIIAVAAVAFLGLAVALFFALRKASALAVVAGSYARSWSQEAAARLGAEASAEALRESIAKHEAERRRIKDASDAERGAIKGSADAERDAINGSADAERSGAAADERAANSLLDRASRLSVAAFADQWDVVMGRR